MFLPQLRFPSPRLSIYITLAKRPDLHFKAADCETFKPHRKFDVIVFNEMLYYTDHVETMKHYTQFLNPNGLFIISVWFSKKIDYLRKSIFEDAEKLFPKGSIGAIEIAGKTLNLGTTRDVNFHIEAFRPTEDTKTA